MDFHHRLMRASMETIIDSLDVERDGKRSIQKGIDLCGCYAKGKGEKRFFQLLNRVLENERHPYNDLLNNRIPQLDKQAVKRLCVNLGYTVFHYGTRQIRQSAMPRWIELFDEGRIKENQDMGIYAYYGQDIQPNCLRTAAAAFPECTFFAAYTQMDNILPMPENVVLTADETRQEDFQLLKKQRRVYGCYTKEAEISMEKLEQMAEQGCLFCVYIGEDRQYKWYTGLGKLNVRTPIIVFDFWNDINLIMRAVQQ